MRTITINTERELKQLIKESRSLITNINGVKFTELYPMLEVTNSHASYYDVNSQSNKFLSSPFEITLKAKTYIVTYDRKIGDEGSIIVKAIDENQALANAKNLCATGSNFRNAVETTEEYTKPRKQGFAGRN